MKLLLIDTDTPNSRALIQYCESLDDVQLSVVSDLGAELFTQDFDAVILPFAGLESAGLMRWKLLAEQLASILDRAIAIDLPVILLSGPEVFDGTKTRAYIENDMLNPVTEFGEWLVAMEEAVGRHDKSLILRSTWTFSGEVHMTNQFIANVISVASEGSELVFNQEHKAYPTAASDLARVLVAMLRQLLLGAPRWGIYHYCGSDLSSPYQFAEALLAVASQHDSRLATSNYSLRESEQDSDPRYDLVAPLLACHHITNTFGIKQRSWRSDIATIAKQYLATEKNEL